MHANTEHYTAVLYGSILKMLPEKALADQALKSTFFKMQTALSTYDSRKMRFLIWAVNIARNECISHLALNKNRSPLIWKKGDENSSVQHDVTPIEKVLIKLIYVRGFTVAEVAKMLGKTSAEINETLQKIQSARLDSGCSA